MKRTRKWAFVAQEAKRLAMLGLSPLEIARRLDVNKSTVTRWMASGKLGRSARRPVRHRVRVRSNQAPEKWAATVRKDYDLDATDQQLVTLAEAALALSTDRTAAAHVRLNAAGRFQALVRQLALVARRAESQLEQPSAPATPQADGPKKNPPVRRPASDPRRLLMVVK